MSYFDDNEQWIIEHDRSGFSKRGSTHAQTRGNNRKAVNAAIKQYAAASDCDKPQLWLSLMLLIDKL